MDKTNHIIAKDPKFTCSVCNMSFETPKDFVAHTKTHQQAEPPCNCGVEIPCPGGTHPPGCLVLHLAKCHRHDK